MAEKHLEKILHNKSHYNSKKSNKLYLNVAKMFTVFKDYYQEKEGIP
jgi:hypothetical protein